jgi:membrane-associated protein
VDLTPDLAGLTTGLVYLVVFGFVFVESGLLIGFILPGDSLLFAAGLVAASERSGVSLPVLVAGVVVAAVVGDSVGYAFGARMGRPWLRRRTAHERLDASHLERAERFYARYGWFAVVAARWIPWVRTFTPILAGTAQMPYPRFLSANVVGALGWGAGLVLLGYFAAGNPWLRNVSYAVALAFVVGSLVVGALGWARRRRSGQRAK